MRFLQSLPQSFEVGSCPQAYQHCPIGHLAHAWWSTCLKPVLQCRSMLLWLVLQLCNAGLCCRPLRQPLAGALSSILLQPGMSLAIDMPQVPRCFEAEQHSFLASESPCLFEACAHSDVAVHHRQASALIVQLEKGQPAISEINSLSFAGSVWHSKCIADCHITLLTLHAGRAPFS